MKEASIVAESFNDVLNQLSEDERYVLEERAAIIQYHGGKSREDAESDALEQLEWNE